MTQKLPLLSCVAGIRLVLITISLCTSLPHAIAETRKLSTEEGVAMAIAAIDKNYSIVSAATGTITLTREDSAAVKQRLKQLREKTGVANDEEDMSSILSDEQQYAVRSLRFVISNDQLKFERTFYDRNRIIVIEGKEYKDFWANDKQLVIKKRHFEVYDYRDPREVFYNASLRLKEMLSAGGVKSAFLTISDSGAAVLQLEFANDQGQHFQVSFDSTVDYLPVTSLQLSKDGQLVEFSGEITYQNVKLDDAIYWFPKSLEFKFWGQKSNDVNTSVDLTEGWRQKFSYEVTDLIVNPKLTSDEFELVVPVGTSIVNEITGEQFLYPQGQETLEAPRSSVWRSRWVTVSLVAMVLALGTAIVVRRWAEWRS